MIKFKAIFYTSAAVGMLALNAATGHISPFFLVVHVVLFALGVSYIIKAARGSE